MTAGIYSLVFGGTYVYIGKSINIETRWKQHWDKMTTGKAAKNVQDAYNRYGEPKTSIIVECHPDHIDLLETISISHNKHLNLLNSAGTATVNKIDATIIVANKDLITKSTADHMREIINLRQYSNELEEIVSNYEDKGIVLPPDTVKLIKENNSLKEDVRKLIKINQMLSLEASKSWWERLFN